MRKRIYCLMPEIERCESLVRDLREAGLSDKLIHIVAREDMHIKGIREANMAIRTNLVQGAELGLSLGGIAGMIGGLLAVTFPPSGLILGGGAILLTSTLAGAGFGGIISALMASGIPKEEVESAWYEIEQGQILVVLDLGQKELGWAAEIVERYCPATSGLRAPPSRRGLPTESGKVDFELWGR